MNRKKALAAILAAAMTLSASPVLAEGITEAVTEGVNAGTDAAGDTLDGLKWSDYAVLIDGVKLQFPATYSDLEAAGWEADGDLSETVDPNSYTWIYFKKGDEQITVDFLNLDINTLPASECIVAGFAVDDYYWPVDTGKIELPSGIVRGVATLEDIQAAYGAPSDSYEGDLYTKLTYKTDVYENIELTVDKETGVLTEIDMENMVQPEGFTYGEVSEEVPEAVTAYTKPASLGDDLSVYQIQVEDKVYDMPVTVQALIDDGWELDADDTDEYLAAKYFGWVTLQKGGQQIHEIAQNPEKNAVLPQNGWIEELTFGLQDTNLPATIPGGISVGMSKDDFLAALEASGASYEVKGEDTDDFVYYNISAEEYGHGYQVIVYQGESDVYPQNTVLTVNVENDVE